MKNRSLPNDLLRVREAFEALGYHKWEKKQPFSPGDLWYRFGFEDIDTFHVAYLGFQPRAKCYGIRLGGFNIRQLSILEAMVPVFYKYMHSSGDLVPPKFSTILAWTLFVPSRGKYLSLSQIPNSLDRGSWEGQILLLQELFLKRLFWRIDSPETLMDVLLQDEFPLEWVVTDPILRAAEIVALSQELGWGVDSIKRELSRFKPLLENRMIIAKNFDVMIDEFIMASLNG